MKVYTVITLKKNFVSFFGFELKPLTKVIQQVMVMYNRFDCSANCLLGSS